MQGIFYGDFMREKTIIMDELAQNRALFRISHEIIEKNKGVKDVVLIGILTRGVTIAKKIKDNIKTIEGIELPFGYIDITLYRDDLSEITDMPKVSKTDIDFSVKDKKVILFDDVLFTGRTARAAIEAVLSLGRPKSIQLAVLIDRGHRELPIRADYVGKSIPTSLSETVLVKFLETDGENSVKLYEKEKADKTVE